MTSYAVPVENTLKSSLKRRKIAKIFVRAFGVPKIGNFCQSARFCPPLEKFLRVPIPGYNDESRWPFWRHTQISLCTHMPYVTRTNDAVCASFKIWPRNLNRPVYWHSHWFQTPSIFSASVAAERKKTTGKMPWRVIGMFYSLIDLLGFIQTAAQTSQHCRRHYNSPFPISFAPPVPYIVTLCVCALPDPRTMT